MWRRVNAAAWLCYFLTSSSVFSSSRQEATVFNYSFFLGRRMELHLPPVCSAETGPLVRMEGAAALTERGRMRTRFQKALWPFVENFKVRPYGPGASALTFCSIPPFSRGHSPHSLPCHHRCVIKKSVALKMERRSTLRGVFCPRSSEWWGGLRTSHVRQTPAEIILPFVAGKQWLAYGWWPHL